MKENKDDYITLMKENIENLKEMYPELAKNKETIKQVILDEKEKFYIELYGTQKQLNMRVGEYE